MAHRQEDEESCDMDYDAESVGSEGSRSPTPSGTLNEELRLRQENAALRQQILDMRNIIEAQSRQLEDQSRRLEKQGRKMEAMHLEVLTAINGTHVALEKKREQTPSRQEAQKRRIESDDEEPPRKTPANGVPQKRRKSPESRTPHPEQAKDPQPTAPERHSHKTDPQEEAPTPKTKIPPVILRKKETWSSVSAKLREAHINFGKAKVIGEGISIQPETVDDFRKMTRLFGNQKWEYHTYSLPEDRSLRVVIRGIPSGTTCDEVKKDLESQGFAPTTVHRMTSRRTKQEIPLVLVQVPLNQEKILEVTRCCYLVVRTERQRTKAEPSQCHRCQRFGHAQSRCTAQAKCVKCGNAHHSAECKKKPDTPAKCANCQGAHPANYRGCPSFPSKRTSDPQHKEAKTTPLAKKVTPGRSYASAASQGQPKAAPEKATPPVISATEMTAALAQMQKMFSAMSAFFAQMPLAQP